MTNLKRITTYVAAVPLALATLFGTFYSRDTQYLKKYDESEYSSILVNSRGSSEGILVGLGNFVRGDLTGLTVGIGNCIGVIPKSENKSGIILPVRLTGASVGVINNTSSANYGLQFGLMNCVNQENGPYLQIGLANISPERWTIGVNFGFGKKDEDLESRVEKQ